ncbi:hypothetical protein CBL_00537 [Carabus blaptoides fortunei]
MGRYRTPTGWLQFSSTATEKLMSLNRNSSSNIGNNLLALKDEKFEINELSGFRKISLLLSSTMNLKGHQQREPFSMLDPCSQRDTRCRCAAVKSPPYFWT